LKLVNDQRKKGCNCGDTYYPAAAALTWNNQLEKAAQVHSNDMAAKKYFSHIAPDGSNAGERIDRQGYPWKTYGENIGLGYATEKEVVQAWIKSPGHCKNLMSAAFTEMGVARSGLYWTQEFGTK
ncbi:MAG TPA: CAP domain-containing protein, partial [Chitinophagaceae bacterium]|nr:CAP domain-containing protein [Chitinophagaceae bacterium]